MHYHTNWETFTHEGQTFVFALAVDDDQSGPWERQDGHGEVTLRRVSQTRGHRFAAKLPGERPLSDDDDGIAPCYNFAKAVKTARADGWGWLPGRLETHQTHDGDWLAIVGSKGNGKPMFEARAANINEAIKAVYDLHRATMSARAYAAGAVEEDFQRCRAFARGDWCYVGVVVALADDDGNPMLEYNASLWGIESDATEYHKEVAEELADDILSDINSKAAGPVKG